MERIDHTGDRFGIQTVIGPCGIDAHGQALWLTACDCGSDPRPVPGGRIRRGASTSCGCAKPAKSAASATRHGDSARGRMTVEYRAWSNMIDRCEREGNRQYADWGGRGIKVCDRWRGDFAAFLADMGRKPSAEHMLDRIDNDGDYAPGNCRWTTRTEQNRNRRYTRRLTVNGETLTLVEWAERAGIDYHALYGRIRAGWAPERAITEPSRRTA